MMIYPIDECDINFYEQPTMKKRESQLMFDEFYRTYSISFPSTKWIKNIIKGTAEQHLVIFRNKHPQKGFVLVNVCI
jgi:hypothetical protein